MARIVIGRPIATQHKTPSEVFRTSPFEFAETAKGSFQILRAGKAQPSGSPTNSLSKRTIVIATTESPFQK